MATLTKGKTFTNGELVTPANLHQMVDAATVANIVNADIASNAAIADSKLAQISTSGKVANSATTATNASTANAIVARDGSGNFSAGTITANLTGNVTGNVTGNASTATTATNAVACSGNAATATILQTARTINGVSFNGSANIIVTATPDAHTHDDRYYTETEINTLLAGKQASGSYAPATGIAPSAITGTAVITTDSRLSDARTAVAHTHDDRYYTETEMNTLLAGKQASGSYAPATGIAPSAITGTAVVTSDPRLSDDRTAVAHTHDDRYYTESEVNTLLADKQKINGQTISAGLNWNGNTGIQFSNIPLGVQKFTLLVEIWLHGYSSAPGQGVVNIGTTTSGLITWNASGVMANPYFAAVNNIEDVSGFPITGGANTAAEHVGVLNFYVTNDPFNPTTKKRLICESHITQRNNSTGAITILQGTGWIDYTGEINEFVLRPRFNSNSVSSAAARLYYYY
jgi:hypothetical protein